MVGTRYQHVLRMWQADMLSARSASSPPSTDQGPRARPHPRAKRTGHSERDAPDRTECILFFTTFRVYDTTESMYKGVLRGRTWAVR